MRIYTNLKRVRGPYGGAYNFMAALMNRLERAGFSFTNNAGVPFEIALLNALSDGLTLDTVRAIADRGVPILHRKVGYIVSGPPEMRRAVDGVVWGDKVQMDFDPFVTTTIFQSDYSAQAYRKQGFSGHSVTVRNGADEDMFNYERRLLFGLRTVPRTTWSGGPLKVVISTWSTDPNKGFSDYLEIDRGLDGRGDVEVTLVGRMPANLDFRNIRHVGAMTRRKLAEFLKQQHVLLTLSRFETCSNALIEGLNCGLPAIYLDSGSNPELAGDYGVKWNGDFDAALAQVKDCYHDIFDRLPNNPFRLTLVANAYQNLFSSVI